jgi:hypothetical protein
VLGCVGVGVCACMCMCVCEYYSALKEETLPFITTWMNLEDTVVSEISQT